VGLDDHDEHHAARHYDSRVRDQPIFYSFLKYVSVGPFLRIVFMPKVSGVDNVPRKGGVLLAGNHLSYFDWLFVPLVMKRMVRYVAKAEYFEGGFKKFFFTNTGNVPIDRSGATAAEGALMTAKRILNEGHIFGIYPEGTRSHDGKLYKGKVGVAVIALETGVPVVPVAVIGTDKLAPQGKKFGRWTRPTIKFGEPMDFSQYAGQHEDREVLRKVTDEIMDRIQELSGQEYVRDTYAADAKKAAKAARKAREADGGSAA
jgi:1-acyl-sn-glycerol-3-phosphate acyltransferase